MKEKKENQPAKENPRNKDKEKIEKLEADLAHWQNEYYRAYADMQNLRKAIEADHREAIKYRAEGFIDELLPILDGFHMALQNEATTTEMKNFLIGFQYIYRNLVNVLENEGVKEFAPKVGDEFNADHMQAVETVVDENNPNKVVKVITNGYKLHEHLIRPAMVIVSIKEKIDEHKEETQEKEEAHEVDA